MSMAAMRMKNMTGTVMERRNYDALKVEASKINSSIVSVQMEVNVETALGIQARRPSGRVKARRVARVSDDAHLRADPANKRALDQAIAQIERGETVRFDPRKPKK